MEFRIGDRVKILDGNGVSSLVGKEGIIRTMAGSGNYVEYGVEFDKHFAHGHNLGGRLNNRNGRYFRESHIGEIKVINKFMECVGDKFKGRKAKVVQNGNTYKLVKTDGTVLYTYIPEKGIARIGIGKDKTEKMYIELFELSIEEFNKEKE